MNEERQNERDSQISAMFDGELTAAECELLARRLTRDDALRGQWTRYALIGAALRAERGVMLHDRVAWRVQSAITQEMSYGDSTAVDASAVRPAAVTQSFGASSRSAGWMRFSRPLLGAGIAAGVAVMSILWLRTQDNLDSGLVARNSEPAASTQIVLTPEATDSTLALNTAPVAARQSAVTERDYSTPAPSSQTSLAPPARLANYVVAHSEYSAPLSRRLALSGLVGGEASMDVEPAAAGTVDQPADANGKRLATDAP